MKLKYSTIKKKKTFLIGLLILFLIIGVLAVAPNKPTLVSPANASINQPLINLLSVNITDGDAGNLEVKIYYYQGTYDTTGNLTYCYQESANISTDCGGLNTGTYYKNDDNKQIDGNWTSWSGYITGYDWWGESLIVNYSIPSGVIVNESYLRYKFYDSCNGFTEGQAIIPNLCDTSNNILSLEIGSTREPGEYGSSNTFGFDCWNGSGYIPTIFTIYGCDIFQTLYFYEEAMNWSISEDYLLKNETIASGLLSSYSWTGLSENTTYKWYATSNDSTDTTQSDLFSFTTGFKPLINEYNISNTSSEYLDSISFWTNTTTTDSDIIQNVSYKLTYPNSTTIQFWNITGSPFYNSTTYQLDAYGVYSFNITSYDNISTASDTKTFNYDISIGNLSSIPSSWTFSQQVGTSSSENFNLTHTADSWVEYNASIQGIEINDANNFTFDLTQERFNITKDGSYIINLNLTSNTSLSNETYKGNLTITRIYDNQKYKIPIIASISTTGVGIIDLINYPLNYKSITINSGGTSQWDLKINNTGNRTLTDCEVSCTGTASSFTTFLNNESFNIAIGTIHQTTVYHNPSLAGTYQGIVQVTCTATAEGGTDTEIITEDISVISNGGDDNGGGSAGESRSFCDLELPDKIIITKNNPVRRLVIGNTLSESITPSWTISYVEGKLDGSNYIKIIGDIGTISGDSEDELSVLIKDESFFDEHNETYYAEISISSSQCQAQSVDVEIRTGDYFFAMPESFEEFINNIVGFQTLELFEIGNYSVQMLVLTLIISLASFGLFIFIYYNKKYAIPKILFSSIGIIILMEGVLWVII